MDGVTLDQVRAWRKERKAQGEPAGYLDFFVVNDICPACLGKGECHEGRLILDDKGIIGIIDNGKTTPCRDCKQTGKYISA